MTLRSNSFLVDLGFDYTRKSDGSFSTMAFKDLWNEALRT